jgi:hypothetical protein
VVHHVEERAGEGGGVADAEAERHVADLPHARVGEHPPHVPLGEGHGRAGHHRRRSRPGEEGERPSRHDAGADHEEQHAEERVGAHLAHHGGHEGRHRGRAVRVGVGQPAVEGEDGRLDREAHDDQGDGDRKDGPPVRREARDSTREVGHVQRPGEGVEVPDPEQVERGGDRPHEEVAERGEDAPPVAAREEGVPGERRDLEEDVEVEDVAGDDHPQQARGEEEEEGVEDALLTRGAARVARRVDRAQERHPRDEDGHRRAERVDDVLDPPWGRPATELVSPGALGQRPLERDEGGDGRAGERGQAQPPPEGPGRERDHRHEEGRHHRDEDDEHRNVLGHSRSFSSSSSSSRVPNRRWRCTRRARATPVVLTLTTMAVSMRACGSGLT